MLYLKRFILAGLFLAAFSAVLQAADVDFRDIDGALGSQTLVPSDVWNGGSKVISNFGGVSGLNATVSSPNQSSDYRDVSDPFYYDNASFMIGAANKKTVVIKFEFSHPISGLFSDFGNFGDGGVKEKLEVSALGSGLVLTDSSGKSITTGSTLTYESGEIIGVSPLINPFISYQNASSITFAYTCDYNNESDQPCRSTIGGWKIDEISLTSTSPADDATGVDVSSNITMTFNEDIKAGTGDIVISDGDGDTRTISIDDPQVSISGSTVTITLNDDLKISSNYYVQIGSTAISNLNGQLFSGINDTRACCPIALFGALVRFQAPCRRREPVLAAH